jgi:ABC-2 type transport system permease protein
MVLPDRIRPPAVEVAGSEWTKLRSLRSTYWTVGAGAVAMVGFGALLSAAFARHHGELGPAAPAGFDPAGYSLSGFFLSQLAMGTLGVLVVTAEYQTGSIRASLTATPQRHMLPTAKAAVLAGVAASAAAGSSVVSFLVGRPSWPGPAFTPG